MIRKTKLNKEEGKDSKEESTNDKRKSKTKSNGKEK